MISYFHTKSATALIFYMTAFHKLRDSRFLQKGSDGC
ncbi:hypothetical protein Caka_2079 [Coraliomargarita akajimensis DSM 45221]|uniref:Uncharacterized protein n=1 Tax=Coraliomargarita akajimensis (strain DSM 45221 / IAM 15411 / JCM 23193 / KCTC 12865 / 04OKA010-24) TaxID=583355 RepID=D5ELG1_CORAD|nr:hypothetical protein Caka_2079 [Coraliomargarita akajimensis DSM 45221]